MDESNNNQMNNNDGEFISNQQPTTMPERSRFTTTNGPQRIIKRLTHSDRKHSNSDLQSRLKTRKLLGVGEIAGDNGDIYRSKISQVLGIHENIYVKLPKGLFWWQTVLICYFSCGGLLCFLLPSLAGKVEIPEDPQVSTTAVRLYGVALLCFAMLLRRLLASAEERGDISSVLKSCFTYFTLQFLVTIYSYIGYPSDALSLYLLMMWRFGAAAVCLAYHELVDPQGGMIRSLRNHLQDMVGTDERPGTSGEKIKSS